MKTTGRVDITLFSKGDFLNTHLRICRSPMDVWGWRKRTLFWVNPFTGEDGSMCIWGGRGGSSVAGKVEGGEGGGRWHCVRNCSTITKLTLSEEYKYHQYLQYQLNISNNSEIQTEKGLLILRKEVIVFQCFLTANFISMINWNFRSLPVEFDLPGCWEIFAVSRTFLQLDLLMFGYLWLPHWHIMYLSEELGRNL